MQFKRSSQAIDASLLSIDSRTVVGNFHSCNQYAHSQFHEVDVKSVIRYLDYVMKGGIVFSTVIMTIACSLQVFSRYILPHPLSWTEEVSRFSFIWWSFLGATYVVRLNGHLGMDVFVNLFPFGLRNMIQRFVFLVTLIFILLVTVQGIKLTVSQVGQEFTMIPISMAWMYGVVPFTGSVMSIYLIYMLFFWPEGNNT